MSVLQRPGFSAIVLAVGLVFASLRLPAAAPLAATTGPSSMSYQGQVLVSGSPFAGTGRFKFAIVNAAGSTSFWSHDNSSTSGGEPGTSVALPVAAGVFSVLLGDTSVAGMTSALTPDVFSGADRRLRVWFATTGAGPFSQLSPDQPLGSVPFALVAETVDGIDGADLQKRITTACGPGQAFTAVDANGTPTCAPFGSLSAVTTNASLTGNGTSGSPLGVTSAFQNRISGACIGSEIRIVNSDGTVVCGASPARVAAPKPNSLFTFNSPNFVDLERSIAIGVDGLPIISFYANTDLRVLHCGTIACDAGNVVNTVESANDVGRYNSIAIGRDGLPIISYYDATNGDLRIAHCSTITCSSVDSIIPFDSGGDVGQYTSITIGSDGFPIVSYYDVTTTALKVGHCTSVLCNSGSLFVVVISGDVGKYNSIAIGTDGLAVISFYDDTTDDLFLAHCGNVACNGGNTFFPIDTTGDVGQFTSIAIGTDGLPIISYYDVTNGNLKVVHCASVLCNGVNTITAVDSGGNVGQYTSLTIGTDGRAIIAYYDVTNNRLKAAHCGTILCDAGNAVTAVHAPGLDGRYTAMAIGSDGLPIIAHGDSNFDIKIVHLGSTNGVPYWRR